MSALASGRRRARVRPQPDCERAGDRDRVSDETPRLFDDAPVTETMPDGPAAEMTLDALIRTTWEALADHATCPLCAGELVATYGAHARPVEGRCTDCGTTLT